jgi:hypothetical protein
MDETLILSSVDISGRAHLTYDLHGLNPTVGGMDTELVKEFFISFVRNADITLHIKQLEGENTQHVGVLNAFADAILNGGKLVADGREGINGLMVSNAMHLSDWLGKEVDLPIDEELYYNLLQEKIASSKAKTADAVDGDTEGSY